MKEIIILLFFISIQSTLAQCQVRISDGSEKYYLQPNCRVSYSVYLKLKSLGKNDSSVINKGIISRKIYYEGLLRKDMDYVGKNKFMTYAYFYKDTNIIRCLLINTNNQVKEIYNFYYEKATNKLIKTIGLAGKKIIYRRIVTKNKNTIITNTMYNDLVVATGLKCKYYSVDSLEEYTIEKQGHQSYFTFNKKQYSNKKQLITEIDSTSDNYYKTTYSYDSIGRINEIKWGDSVLISIKIYNYYDNETAISTFRLHFNSKQLQLSQPSELQTLKYNDFGDLVYEKTINYDKDEGVIAPSGSAVPVKSNLSIGEVVEKFYNNKHLQKTLRRYEGDREYEYTIKYY